MSSPDKDRLMLDLPARLFEKQPGDEDRPVSAPVNGTLVMDFAEDHMTKKAAVPSSAAMVEPSELFNVRLYADSYTKKPLMSEEQIRAVAARLDSLDEGYAAMVKAKMIGLVMSAPTSKKSLELALRVLSGAVGLFP